MHLRTILDWTLLGPTLDPKESAACIQACKNAPEIQAVRNTGAGIFTPGVAGTLPKRAQRAIKKNLAGINADFNNLEENTRAGHGVLKIILHGFLFVLSVLFALACDILIITESGFLGETVYVIRNLGFFFLAFLELVTFIIWAHATYRLIWRLTRARLATGAVTMFLYFLPAFFVNYRYLYETTYYTWVNAGLTATWLFFYQILPDIMGWWLLRSLRKSSLNNTAEQDREILAVLGTYEGAVGNYDTLIGGYEIAGPFSMFNSTLTDRFSAIINILEACLSPAARTNRVPNLTPEQIARQKRERRVKIVLFFVAIAIQTAVFVSFLIKQQWLSFVQTLIYLINVSMILGRLAFNIRQPLRVFMDTFNRMVIINFLTFFLVSIPVLAKKNIFDPAKLWIPMAVLILILYIFLSVILAKLLIRFLTWCGLIDKSADAPEAGQELAAQRQ